ncbi:MAG: bifunctional phosphoribosylaminoimidazolecarboxamide formyltransferase/IMP cyclohydrolase, partial [Bdellovibrionota bacterium]
MPKLKIRRALLTVSDKTGVVELATALHHSGAELVATGKTAKVLEEAGLPITPIEKISGSPEAFQGRMKTLSFPVCSGILYRRGDSSDEADLMKLSIQPIDCVVVNFYPFELAAAKLAGKRGHWSEAERSALVEEVDIGGPTLVRAAAKNAPDVLVLTSPNQYRGVISELEAGGGVSAETSGHCAEQAWERVLSYDAAIARELGGRGRRTLRYGENPHQKGFLEFDPEGPIDWGGELTASELSYNNILDLSAAYGLASDLQELDPTATGVVIVKHNNPCGVALIPKQAPHAQKLALMRAWEGDPVSAFGGVLVFTDALEPECAAWLSDHFVELVAAPGLGKPALAALAGKRKNLKAVSIRRFGGVAPESMVVVPGGRLFQTTDLGIDENFKSVTKKAWPGAQDRLGRFGVAVCRALKSNAIAIVREISGLDGAL